MSGQTVIIIAVYLLLANMAAFALFGIDKRKAVRGAWRIPEKTLFIAAGVGGSIGALLGMLTFHHKTRKLPFQIGIPVILLVQVLLAAVLVGQR